MIEDIERKEIIMSKKKICLITAGLLVGAAIGAAAAYVLFVPEEKKSCLCLKLKREDA